MGTSTRIGVVSGQMSDQPVLNVFSMDSGERDLRAPIADNRPRQDYVEQRSPSWSDELGPLVSMRTSLLEPMSEEEPVAVSPHWGDARCTMWASHALAGSAQAGPGPLEWRYWEWLWWWKQLLAGLVVGALVLVGYVRRRGLA